MDDMVKVFDDELKMFYDSGRRDLTEDILDSLPSTILTLPASTTGKYHPGDELGPDGMILHIKRACRLVDQAASKYGFTKYGRDVLLAGCLVHDAYKDGDPPTGHTVGEHPYLIYQFLHSLGKYTVGMGRIFIADVAEACAWHEGHWTTELCKDIPQTDFGRALHEIDFWVTRREMWEVMRWGSVITTAPDEG